MEGKGREPLTAAREITGMSVLKDASFRKEGSWKEKKAREKEEEEEEEERSNQRRIFTEDNMDGKL